MTETSYWSDEGGVTHLKQRRLETLCPPLKSYLHPGATVLDVGCGPGPVTLDVASAVAPGAVVGLDREEQLLRSARVLADQVQITNVTFQRGDAYALDFANQTFDLTYSLNLLGWLTEPLRALAEQRRVTRLGGWVIVGGLLWEARSVYPACPAFERFMNALRYLKDPADPESHVDFYLTPELVALFAKVGFQELEVKGYAAPTFCVYPGSDYFEDRYQQYRDHLKLDGAFAPRLNKLLTMGVIEETTLVTAQQEIEAWHAHPHAFHLMAGILVAGRVA